MMPAGYVCGATIHRTLTWTTGSLLCAQMLMQCDCAWGCADTERESELKVDSWKKISCRTGESKQRQRRDGPMLQPTELHPIPKTAPTIPSDSSRYACGTTGAPRLATMKEGLQRKTNYCGLAVSPAVTPCPTPSCRAPWMEEGAGRPGWRKVQGLSLIHI